MLDETQLGFGLAQRAPYASDPWKGRGRLIREEASRTRSDFQRDRDRIIHSTAFRRLKHKTQVFVAHEGDHYRTRLTHTIEVAQIARGLARALKLDEDLAEGVALVHDFGHTPFGHTGEEALDQCLGDFGGFDHNAQSLRVVTRLERRYGAFDGLNLTWETLEGLVKHNGPLIGARAAKDERVPQPVLDYCRLQDLELDTFASLEAQAAAIADDIAYNTHDIDDGLRAGLLSLEMLEDVPFLREMLGTVRQRFPELDPERTAHEIMRRQITLMVEDVISTAQQRLAEDGPQSVDAVRAGERPIAVFSAAMSEADRSIKAFLYENLYRHPSVMVVREQASRIVRDLFDAFMQDPTAMKGHFWQQGADDDDPGRKARHVADYLAGMTDTYALSVHRQLFDHTPDLR
ncbi:deoxyguanosinetriphosphate triphosphohydrolase [Pararhizobium haloflavum]|uniref:deoxyguanosinetriphosphate triphosphohydrolase n=1 Tax=Pararhizobium haloflavum TaxID=2037914 RepID=UPI000C175C15|nr:deoxyguanosinetriphosphate triphosphohydrolase [Pararhizobium haloflavum]